MKRTTLLVTACMTAFVWGCAQSPEVTDEEWISSLLSSSDLVRGYGLNGTGDPGKGSVGLPEVWYRELLSEPGRQIILENDPAAGVCTVTVIHNIDAQLVIDTVQDGVFEPGYKPISDIRFVRAALERDETAEGYGGWDVVSVTPARHMLASGEQEVFIASMKIWVGDELIWECADPGQFYDVRSELPCLREGDLARMEVTVNHMNPAYEPPFFVIAHGPLSGHPRHIMYDNGLYGDQAADDGVYTYEWYVEYTSEHRRIAADVIDADTFADQVEDDYDAGAWGIAFSR